MSVCRADVFEGREAHEGGARARAKRWLYGMSEKVWFRYSVLAEDVSASSVQAS